MALVESYVSTTGAGAHTGVDEANAFSWAEMLTDSATSAAGTRYNIKNNATYSRTTNSDALGAGTTTSPKIYRGYSTTIGDGYLGRTNGTEDIISTNMPVITYTTGRLAMGAQNIVESLNLDSAHASASGTLLAQANGLITRCIINCTGTATNTSLAISGNSVAGLTIFNNDISQTAASGTPNAIRALSNAKVIGNRIRAARGDCVSQNAAGSPLFAFNLFYNSVRGIDFGVATSATVMLNTFYGMSGDAIDAVTGSTILEFGNCITDNTGFGADWQNANNTPMILYNRTRDNIAGAYNLGTDWVTATSYGEVTTDTGGPETDYVDAAGGDFSLISSSPAVSAALPSFLSMGAFQRSQLSTSSGYFNIPTIPTAK